MTKGVLPVQAKRCVDFIGTGRVYTYKILYGVGGQGKFAIR